MNIIITGSSGFIGSYLKDKLGEKYNIIPFDINDKENSVNALNEDEVKNYFINLKNKYDNIPVLINCLGVPDSADKLEYKDITDIDILSFKKLVDINLIAVFIIIKEYIKHYQNCKGNIINLSSMYSVISPRLDLYNGKIKNPGYIASKSGLVGMVKYISVLISKYDVKINCIAPAAVAETPGVEGEFLEKYNKNVPIGRPVNMNDILSTVNYLLNNKNMTGQNLLIDGGYTLW